MNTTQWSIDEIDFLLNNYMNMTNKEIAEYLNRTKAAVDIKLNKLGIKKSKYQYNQDFFKSIETKAQAYWLGFISADGYISYSTDPANYELGIELCKNDWAHLRKFNKSLDGNIEVKFRVRKSSFDGTLKEMAFIRVYSKKIVEDLMSYGITPNKSLFIKFPKDIPDEILSHYIRGYFDANGCVSINNKKRQDLQFNFTSGSPDFINELREKLYTAGINSYIYQDGVNTFRLFIKGVTNCDRFVSYIYEDSDKLFLERKLKKIIELYKKTNKAQYLPLHLEIDV